MNFDDPIVGPAILRMTTLIFFDRLSPGAAPIELPIQLEDLDETAETPVVLGHIGWHAPPPGKGRLILYDAAQNGAGIRLAAYETSRSLDVAVPVVPEQGRAVLAAARADLRAYLARGDRPDVISLKLGYSAPGGVPPEPKPLSVRPRLKSRRPPIIKPVVTETSPVQAEALMMSAEPMAFTRLRIGKDEESFACERPKAEFHLQRGHQAAGSGMVRSDTLYVRRVAEEPGPSERWVSLASFEPIPLPDPFTEFVLEFGLAVRDFAAWERSRSADGKASIPIDLILQPPGGQSEWQRESVSLAPRVEGTLRDVLVLQQPQRTHQHRCMLDPESTGPAPRVSFVGVRTFGRRGFGRSAFEPVLEDLEFEAFVSSDDAEWCLKGTADLFDKPDPEDASTSAKQSFEARLLRGEPARIRVPLPDLTTELVTRECQLDDGLLRLTLTLHRADAPERVSEVEVRMPVSVASAVPYWLICIDFGASAIAIGVAKASQSQPVAVPLGDWFRIVPEFRYDLESPQGQASSLLPSIVGLSTRLNMRSSFDPTSFGDLAAVAQPDHNVSGHMDVALSRRLDATGCTYDVSVPFLSSRRILDFPSEVVLNLKRELASGRKAISASAPVWRKSNDVLEVEHDIDIATLFEDCVSELGAFVLPRALQHAFDSGGPLPLLLKEFQSQLTSGDSDEKFGLVLTHPFGLEPRQIAVYREAGRRFLAGFLGLPPDVPVPGSILPVPEALAAARYGIAELQRRDELKVGEWVRIVCLDIGASTYDVTIIDAQPKAARLSEAVLNWTIRGHFGLLIGGRDLDIALAHRMIGIVAKIAKTERITDLFQVETDLVATYSEISKADRKLRRKQLSFLKAIQEAKKDLTEACLKIPGAYAWNRRQLEIEIGAFYLPNTERDDLPLACLRPEEFLLGPNEEQTFPIEGCKAELRAGRKNGTPFVRLLVPEEMLDEKGRTADGGDLEQTDLGTLTGVLSQHLPRLAASIAEKESAEPIGKPTGPVWWIVTGRTALWPSLYSGIAQIAAERNGKILDQPFAPANMKQAVQEGALRLAIDTRLALTGDMLPTIAVLASDVTPLAENVLYTVTTSERHQLIRLIPGLDLVGREESDAMCAAFEAVEIQPWVKLATLPAGLHSLRLARKEGSLWVTAEFQSKPPERYGPYREDRIYGHE